MFDLEKFKTGKYFVYLPTKEIYDEAVEFLEENGFHWIGEKSMKDFNPWISKSEHFCMRYDVNEKAICHASYGYYSYDTRFKELPTTKDKDKIKEALKKENYSLHIGGEDYTDKLVCGDTVSTNETKPNDLVKSPNHYIGELGLEVEEVLRNFIPRYEDGYVAHRMASAIEYLLRAPLKNGEQDLEKAGYNIQQALEHIRKKEEK